MEAYEQGYTSHSEVESLSDSDWLDIASSGASGDTDSITGFDDSDRDDLHDRPPSRRSLASLPSSREGEVEGWEGLIEDNADGEPIDHPAQSPAIPPSPSLAVALEVALTSHAGVQDDTDDELVKAGLEQSMMSTLSASRSNSLSGSMQTSVVRSRDLRLSFPDPLTSSPEQSLNNSYENLSPADLDLPQKDAHASNAAPEVAPTPAAADHAPQVAAPEVSQKRGTEGDYTDVPSAITPDFSIVLYGLSALAQSPLLDNLLEKWAISAGLILSCNLTHAPGVMTRVFIANGESQRSKQLKRFVSIIDRTGLNYDNNPTESLQSTCPSLAIVGLPTFSRVQLPAHTLYLPITIPQPLAVVDILPSSDLFEAEQQWADLHIPASKLTSLSSPSFPVVNPEKIRKARASQVHSALKPLFFKPQKKPIKRSIPTNAITILTVVSAVLGYAVHGSWNSTSISAKNVATPTSIETLGSINATFDKASAVPPTSITFSDSNLAIASAPPKELDVAVLDSLTASVATTSAEIRQPPIPSTSSASHADSPRVASSAPSECTCGCGLVTWPGKPTTKDVSLRPEPSTSSLSLDTRTKALTFIVPKSDIKGKGKEKDQGSGVSSYHDVSFSAISTRIAGSIQQYLDFKTITTLNKVDIQEVLDAIDLLVSAIQRQTDYVVQQSRGTIDLVRNEFRARNARAKKRARELREIGGRFLVSVQDKIKEQTEVAKENAKILRENLGKEGREMRKLKKALRREARKLRKMQRKSMRKGGRVVAFE